MKKFNLKWKLTILTMSIVSITSLVIYILLGITSADQMTNIEEAVMNNLNIPDSKETLMIVPDISALFYTGKSLFWLKSFAITVVVVIISGVIAYKLADKFLTPLSDLNKRMKEVNDKNLSKSLDIRATGDEIEELSVSFNEMIDRLSKSFKDEKNFLQNAAHELRTPLAVLKTKLDVFNKESFHSKDDYKNLIDGVKAQNEDLSHLVELLLQIEESKTIERSEEVELYDLIEEISMDLEPLYEEKNINFSLDGDKSKILGSDILLYRVFYNLIENAIKYNFNNGQIKISIDDYKDRSVVHIKDTGIGIKPGSKDKIFDAFFRDKRGIGEAKGAGLGLHLVKKIVELHRGEIEVLDVNPSGSEFVVKFYKKK